MRTEVDDLEKRVKRLRDKVQGKVVDTVKASYTEYPYIEHNVTVRGYSEATAAYLAQTSQALAQQRTQLARELSEIEAWISTVSDSRTRQLIRYRYIDGRSWASAATRAYGYPCADAARMRVTRLCEERK